MTGMVGFRFFQEVTFLFYNDNSHFFMTTLAHDSPHLIRGYEELSEITKQTHEYHHLSPNRECLD